MFFDRVSELCKKRGTSPSAVAREIGLNNSSATYWKRGSIPKGDTLQKLADFFGVSIDYLLGKDDLYDETEFILNRVVDEYELSEIDRRIVEIFLKLDDPARSALLGYANRLAEERHNKPVEQDIPMDINSQLEEYRRGLLMGIATAQADYSVRPEDIDIDSVTLTPELKAMVDNALEKQRHILEAERQEK